MNKQNDSSDEYNSYPAIRRTLLFEMSKSPLHYYHAKQNQKEPTEAMIFGRAFHTFVLEPEKFNNEVNILPKIDRRTKAGKELWNEATSNGKITISEEDLHIMEGMKDSIFSNKYAAQLLNGEHEVSYYWADEFTGLDCKCRCDSLISLPDFGVVVDIKTCANAETKRFMLDADKYGYDLQAAMYKAGVETVEKKRHIFVFIAVEKDPPFAVNILEADELVLKSGEDKFREYLGRIKECTESGNWYGYNGFSGQPNVLGLPAWRAKDYE